MQIEIRPLRLEDERSSFSSGDIELDRFFRNYPGLNQFRLHLGTTHVAVGDGTVVGYATVAPGSIAISQLPRSERRKVRYPNPVSTTLLRLFLSASRWWSLYLRVMAVVRAADKLAVGRDRPTLPACIHATGLAGELRLRAAHAFP